MSFTPTPAVQKNKGHPQHGSKNAVVVALVPLVEAVVGIAPFATLVVAFVLLVVVVALALLVGGGVCRRPVVVVGDHPCPFWVGGAGCHSLWFGHKPVTQTKKKLYIFGYHYFFLTNSSFRSSSWERAQ